MGKHFMISEYKYYMKIVSLWVLELVKNGTKSVHIALYVLGVFVL